MVKSLMSKREFTRKARKRKPVASGRTAFTAVTERIGTGNENSRGWVIVYTGEGKGKTTAALGIALRAIGHNMKVCVIQFIKGSWFTGELKGGQLLAPSFKIIRAGKGFVKIIDDRKPFSAHIAAAKEALRTSEKVISSGLYDVVILDEINYAANRKLIGLRAVLGLIRRKPARVALVLTGRGAPQPIIALADLVTEMRKIKHPYDKGMTARKGIDF
jgi:cob(I)alamin adenosyltransferase